MNCTNKIKKTELAKLNRFFVPLYICTFVSYDIVLSIITFLRDRTGKRRRPMKMSRLMVTARKFKMASFSRSAVNAVVR
jgi:hypothetical protein